MIFEMFFYTLILHEGIFFLTLNIFTVGYIKI